MKKFFSEILVNFIGSHSLSALEGKTGIPQATIKGWTEGRADKRGPQRWSPLVRLAAAVRLTPVETTELLQSAEKPSFEQICGLIPDDNTEAERALTRDAIEAIQALESNTDVVETIIQEVRERIKSDAPPLFVNVPSKPKYFFGRDLLVETLVKRLLSGDTISLSAEGMAGVGKTALAIYLSYNEVIRAHFKDGVLWGGLGPTPDVMSTLAQWSNELERDVSHLTNVNERAQEVRNAIGQRHFLIVIDDGWDSESTELLRCGGPNCCHILTTRDQGVARDFAGLSHVQNVSVLDEETAYDFLEALAPEACAVDPESARKLVEATGGLPLAIELLGGYLAQPEYRYFPDRSKEAFEEMDDPARRLQLARQRLGSLSGKKTTIQEVIALSLEGLLDQHRQTFYALGAFAPKPETFTLKAAQETAKAVIQADAGTLAVLIERNLLGQDKEETLHLHQTVADAARTQTSLEAVERHRDYYLTLVNEDKENNQRIDSVYGQIKHAWSKAPDDKRLSDFQWALYTYQTRRGLWDESIRWMQRVIRLSKEKKWQLEESRLLANLGILYINQGSWEEAISAFEQGLVVYRDRESINLMNLGIIYRHKKCWDKAIFYIEQSLAIHRESGSLQGQGYALNNLGNVYNDQEQWDEAIEMYEQSLAIFRKLDDTHSVSIVLHNLGELYYQQDRLDEAISSFEQSLAISRQLDDLYGEGQTLHNLGIVYNDQGKRQEARDCLNEALTKLHPKAPEFDKVSKLLQEVTLNLD